MPKATEELLRNALPTAEEADESKLLRMLGHAVTGPVTARRSGRARALLDATGQDTPFAVKHPRTSKTFWQLLGSLVGAGAGASLGSVPGYDDWRTAMTSGFGTAGMIGGSLIHGELSDSGQARARKRLAGKTIDPAKMKDSRPDDWQAFAGSYDAGVRDIQGAEKPEDVQREATGLDNASRVAHSLGAVPTFLGEALRKYIGNDMVDGLSKKAHSTPMFQSFMPVVLADAFQKSAGSLPSWALPAGLAVAGAGAGYLSGEDEDEDGEGGTRGRNALIGAILGGGGGMGANWLLERLQAQLQSGKPDAAQGSPKSQSRPNGPAYGMKDYTGGVPSLEVGPPKNSTDAWTASVDRHWPAVQGQLSPELQKLVSGPIIKKQPLQ